MVPQSVTNVDIQLQKMIFNNQKNKTMLYLLLILYITILAPKMSKNISKIFDYSITRIILLIICIYLSFRDYTLAILLIIAITISLIVANKNSIDNEIEHFIINKNII